MDSSQPQPKQKKGTIDQANDLLATAQNLRFVWRVVGLVRTSVAATAIAPLLPIILLIIAVIFIMVIVVIIIISSSSPGSTGPDGPVGGGGGPTPTFAPPAGGYCELGNRYCERTNLLGYFNDEGKPATQKATEASIVCQKESGSNSEVLNTACLNADPGKRTLDFSVGLFQINILAHCPGAFTYTQNPVSCTIINQQKLDDCVRRFRDPANNIAFAVQLSANGNNWGAWGGAIACGIH